MAVEARILPDTSVKFEKFGAAFFRRPAGATHRALDCSVFGAASCQCLNGGGGEKKDEKGGRILYSYGSLRVLRIMLEKVGSWLYWIATALGGPGLLLIAILDSSFLSIPEGNDILIVILSSGQKWGRMAYFVAMTTVGSIIGCLLLYTVGRKGGSPALRRRFSAETVEWAEKLFEKYGILTVVVPSILPPPCPFKIFVLSAGVFRLPPGEFILAVAIGRTCRYSMWGILAVLYGEAVKDYMKNNLPLVGLVLFAILALALAAIIWIYARQKRAGRAQAPGA